MLLDLPGLGGRPGEDVCTMEQILPVPFPPGILGSEERHLQYYDSINITVIYIIYIRMAVISVCSSRRCVLLSGGVSAGCM